MIGASNLFQISLFATTYLALLILALIPHGLGLLVLIPVTAGAMYTCYKRVSMEYRTQSPLPAFNALQVTRIEKASKGP